MLFQRLTAMSSYRKERLEELIKRVIAETLLREIKDPRIGFVTVTKVKLSKDLSIGDVWISVIGEEKEKKLSMAGIHSAGGYIQRIVGKNIKIRSIPKLRFHLDTSIEQGVKMVHMLENLDREGE
jgi:ribosome-binding factor A